jgi:hypothetical protein
VSFKLAIGQMLHLVVSEVARKVVSLGLDHPAEFAADELANSTGPKPSDILAQRNHARAQVEPAFASHKPRDQGEGSGRPPKWKSHASASRNHRREFVLDLTNPLILWRVLWLKKT